MNLVTYFLILEIFLQSRFFFAAGEFFRSLVRCFRFLRVCSKSGKSFCVPVDQFSKCGPDRLADNLVPFWWVRSHFTRGHILLGDFSRSVESIFRLAVSFLEPGKIFPWPWQVSVGLTIPATICLSPTVDYFRMNQMARHFQNPVRLFYRKLSRSGKNFFVAGYIFPAP